MSSASYINWHHVTSLEEVEVTADQCAAFVRSLQSTMQDVGDAIEDVYKAAKKFAYYNVYEFPKLTKKIRHEGAIKRLCNPSWWLRRIRKLYRQKAEQAKRVSGAVCRGVEVYCSNRAVHEHKKRKYENQKALSQMRLVSEDGSQVFTVLDLAEKSISNPYNRMSEFFVRMRGMQEFAEDLGYVVRFVTITTPSRFHTMYSGGTHNKNYDGVSTPADAQDWLNLQFSRIRAKYGNDEIDLFGMRVAEPHHDGTPHWHAALFMSEENADRVKKIIGSYVYEAGDSASVQAARFDYKDDVPVEKATAYIAKYLSKNMSGLRADGSIMGIDNESEMSTAKAFERVEAWASLWRIRQFQQIGAPSITKWRELRRVHEPVQHEMFERVRKAVDSSEYKVFMKHGDKIELEKEQTENVNQYGELVDAEIIGLRLGVFVVLTREKVWLLMSAEAYDTWSSVNNCTDDFEENFYENAHSGQSPPLEYEEYD